MENLLTLFMIIVAVVLFGCTQLISLLLPDDWDESELQEGESLA